MGVKGGLLDCAGPDYGVRRARVALAVSQAHRLGLHVLVNSLYPRAALGVGLWPGDAWLAENWIVTTGRPNRDQSGVDWHGLSLLKRYGIAVWMTATASSPPMRRWVIYWASQTAHRIGGSHIAVAGPRYSSHTNFAVPEAWLKASP